MSKLQLKRLSIALFGVILCALLHSHTLDHRDGFLRETSLSLDVRSLIARRVPVSCKSTHILGMARKARYDGMMANDKTVLLSIDHTATVALSQIKNQKASERS